MKKYLTGTLILLGVFTLSTFTAAQEFKAGKVFKNVAKEGKAVESAAKTAKTAENVEKTVKAGEVIKTGENAKTAEAVTKAGEVNLPKVSNVNPSPKVVASAPVSTSKVSNTLGGAELDSLTKGIEEAKVATEAKTGSKKSKIMKTVEISPENDFIQVKDIGSREKDEALAKLTDEYDFLYTYERFIREGVLDATITVRGKEHNFLDRLVYFYPEREDYKLLKDAFNGDTLKFKTLFEKYPGMFEFFGKDIKASDGIAKNNNLLGGIDTQNYEKYVKEAFSSNEIEFVGVDFKKVPPTGIDAESYICLLRFRSPKDDYYAKLSKGIKQEFRYEVKDMTTSLDRHAVRLSPNNPVNPNFTLSSPQIEQAKRDIIERIFNTATSEIEPNESNTVGNMTNSIDRSPLRLSIDNPAHPDFLLKSPQVEQAKREIVERLKDIPPMSKKE